MLNQEFLSDIRELEGSHLILECSRLVFHNFAELLEVTITEDFTRVIWIVLDTRMATHQRVALGETHHQKTLHEIFLRHTEVRHDPYLKVIIEGEVIIRGEVVRRANAAVFYDP